MTPNDDPRPRLARLTALYAAAGLPLTSQRRTLLEVLAERTDHPTVDQIYSAISARLPEVSRTTVYRSLEVLSGLGILKRVEHPGSAVRFDANLDAHHHFLCTRCGSLADLPPAAIAGCEGLRFVGSSHGTADEVAVLVRGRCASCAAAER